MVRKHVAYRNGLPFQAVEMGAGEFPTLAASQPDTRMRQVQIVHDVNRNASTVATIDETSHINHINFADAVRTVSWKLMFSLCCCF